jgi:riboflavin biosynthesis pyrimidine reductase
MAKYSQNPSGWAGFDSSTWHDPNMIRRVFPDSAATTIADSYAQALDQRSSAPWVGLCMVSSIDGSTVVGGKSSELSSTNDMAVLHGLRSIADVILVGAGTVRGEGYGPPKTPGQRVGVVTASGNVDTTLPLFTGGAGFIITTDHAKIADSVDVIRAGGDNVDLSAVVGRLSEMHPSPSFVQAEGGALLNGALLDADLIDEINLTTSPLCVGGSGPRVTTGAANHTARYELAQMVIDDQTFVFSRWLRKR